MTDANVATGDLGQDIEVESSADQRPETTPAGWSTSQIVGKGRDWRAARPVLLTLAVLVFLVGIGAALSVFTDKKSSKTQESSVSISVKGVPQNAKIYYKNALVNVNPFPVDRGGTITPLRVEAEGFKPVTVTVIPSEDQVVEVKLKRIDSDTAIRTADEAHAKEKKANRAEVRPPSSTNDSKERRGSSRSSSIEEPKLDETGFRKGRGGSEFTRKFE